MSIKWNDTKTAHGSHHAFCLDTGVVVSVIWHQGTDYTLRINICHGPMHNEYTENFEANSIEEAKERAIDLALIHFHTTKRFDLYSRLTKKHDGCAKPEEKVTDLHKVLARFGMQPGDMTLIPANEEKNEGVMVLIMTETGVDCYDNVIPINVVIGDNTAAATK